MIFWFLFASFQFFFWCIFSHAAIWQTETHLKIRYRVALWSIESALVVWCFLTTAAFSTCRLLLLQAIHSESTCACLYCATCKPKFSLFLPAVSSLLISVVSPFLFLTVQHAHTGLLLCCVDSQACIIESATKQQNNN